MNVLVTGAAGFVGSHLCERLLADGHAVTGVDCLTDYYDPAVKQRNLRHLAGAPGWRFVRDDLATMDLAGTLDGVRVVFHLAGQPGVRASWGADFAQYVRQNVLVTQRLLEASVDRQLAKFVYASSSSVYGDAECYPTDETVRPRPVSPYGVTKLAGEHLCEVYRRNLDVPTASLRFFTVYGPRQRPDMAFARLVDAVVTGHPFSLYGDGSQTRDFTYVGDIVEGLYRAATSTWTGVANLGGGNRVSMRDVIDTVGALAGRPVPLLRHPRQSGDVKHTAADTTVARDGFGYVPATSLEQGLRAMLAAASADAGVLAG